MYPDFFEPCSRADAAVLQKNRPMTNICQVLISGEGYLTDAMRYAGADEKYITGECSDFERFRELCRVYPFFKGNAAQYVCREILNSIFGINEELSKKNCEAIWVKTADVLAENPLTPTELLRRLNVGGMGILTDICADPSTFEKLEAAAPVLCPDSILSVDKRGYKRILATLEEAVGHKICDISSFDRAVLHLVDGFASKGCNLVVLSGLCDGDFGKCDYFHAENAMLRAVATGGNILPEEARDFRRYEIRKIAENCRAKKLDLMLEFCIPSIEILPDVTTSSIVERRIWLNFSESEAPLAKECTIDLHDDLQAQFSAHARRYAIGNMPQFFVGTANLCELCLHGFYRDELRKFSEKL